MNDKRIIFDGLPVSARAGRVLSALSVETWAEVATRSPLDFLRHPHCGAVTIRELRGHVTRRVGPLRNHWAMIAPRDAGTGSRA